MSDVKKELLDLQQEFIDTVFGEIQCDNCNHFRSGNECDAFPDGIPLDIIAGEFDHRNPYPNAEHPTDRGIRFEPK